MLEGCAATDGLVGALICVLSGILGTSFLGAWSGRGIDLLGTRKAGKRRKKPRIEIGRYAANPTKMSSIANASRRLFVSFHGVRTAP
jgi:hypothetical protein